MVFTHPGEFVKPTRRGSQVMLLRRRGRHVLRGGLAAVVVAASAVTVSVVATTAARAETVLLPASGTVRVTGNGNGHGHGMSQYGARGAAQSGRTAQQIIAFYYPHTTLGTMSSSTIMRVNVTAAGSSYTRVKNAVSVKSGATSVALATGTMYQVVPSGSGLLLQALSGSVWTNKGTLGSQADFSPPSGGMVRLYLTDGTSTDYHGTVGGVRNGGGLLTINRVSLDEYTQGVEPRESPSSWPAAAVQAQAIAARTYGEYEREHSGGLYDICDTTNCQVYGGARHYDSGGNLLWQDYPAALSGNAGSVIMYGGSAAFAQFSASDGGWSVSGGQPYLVAQADPYDSPAAGDPYIHWTKDVPVSQIASYYGLAHVNQIQITQRDGHGEWGGRVLAADVIGTTSSGQGRTVSTTGFGLQDALGVMHNWFTIASVAVSRLGGSVVHSTATSATVFYFTGGSLTARDYVTGSGWHAPVGLGAPSAGLGWDPDASSWGGGHIDLFARDKKGDLVSRAYSPSTGWSAWRDNGVTILSSPAVTDPVVNEGDVFWLGPNHTLQTIKWTKASGWTSPAAVPGVTNVDSGPDATTLITSKNVVVAYRGTDGWFWTVTRAGGTWQAPLRFNSAHALPVPAQGVDPAVTNSGADTPNLMYTGTDGIIYHSSDQPTTHATTIWYPVPGPGTTSAPDAWNDSPNHADVVSGHNGIFGTASSSPSGWRPWAPLL